MGRNPDELGFTVQLPWSQASGEHDPRVRPPRKLGSLNEKSEFEEYVYSASMEVIMTARAMNLADSDLGLTLIPVNDRPIQGSQKMQRNGYYGELYRAVGG
jgi:hypothetical protein